MRISGRGEPRVFHGGYLQGLILRFQKVESRTLRFKFCSLSVFSENKKFLEFLLGMVRLEGFEPPTFRFVAERSIQLSYNRMCVCTEIIIRQLHKKVKKNRLKKAYFSYKTQKALAMTRGVSES